MKYIRHFYDLGIDYDALVGGKNTSTGVLKMVRAESGCVRG